MEHRPNNLRIRFQRKWQWKSNPDPWSETEESCWESYLPENNYLIEKAYHEKNIEVDIGDYIISIQHMIQLKKGNITLQRPIRRIICEDEETDVRSERYFETELPKTINKIFGSLEHFISFFSKRNPEILELTGQFQKIEQSNDLNGLNKEILPQLISHLEKELLKPVEDQLSDLSISEALKKSLLKIKERHEKLISLFKKECTSFKEFYGLILRSYTMNSDLYLNLNKYLRNENWTAIDNLLPYAVCLCKAFFSLKQIIPLEEEKKIQHAEASMILYRGTALDELAISSYQTEKNLKLFSWNSVTSTSTNRKIAEKFMYESVDLENKKYPVLFIIEISLINEPIKSKYLKWIDIHQYSAIPNEDEFILAPGSVFEIQQIYTDQEKRTTIKIKLKHEVESLAHGGLIMQGALQEEMMSDNQMKIMCLEGEELSEALRSISGNRLIEKIEFCLCVFDKKSLEEMLKTLPTLKELRGLKFISCNHEDDQEIFNKTLNEVKSCSALKIKISEVQQFFQIFSFGEYWKSLKTLSIEFRYLGAKGADNFVLQGLENLTHLTSLTLDFSYCFEITDERIKNLASQGLKPLIQLTSLELDFSYCSRVSHKGSNSLISQGIKYLTQLASLTLNFSACKIRDEGVKNLTPQELKYLVKLTSLTLNFEYCGLELPGNMSLYNLKHLPHLEIFTLSNSEVIQKTENRPKRKEKYEKIFGNPSLIILMKRETTLSSSEKFPHSLKNINDKIPFLSEPRLKDTLFFELIQELDLNNPLSEKSLQLCNLKSLTLDFSSSFSYEATKFEGFRHLTQLASLDLNFNNCQIKDEGVNILAFHGLKNLTWLTSLTLSFSGWLGISDEGVENLVSKGLINITQLTSFALNFYSCKITEEGINTLAFQGLKSFIQLTSLALSFNGCFRVTDQGVKNLATQGLRHLIQLTSLTLDFSSCRQITDEGMENLAFQGLKYLIQLTSLTLNFSNCPKIGDKGMENIASQGLENLTKLTSLTLSFQSCSQITDKGMKNIVSQGFKFLTKLIFLALDFQHCQEITDEGTKSLAEGLKSFPQLASVTLKFVACNQITGTGVNYLASQGLKYLNQLASLNLDFSFCKRISDDGLNGPIYHITRNFVKLTSLALNFSSCTISKFTTLNIIRVLHYFGFTQNKNSDFKCDSNFEFSSYLSNLRLSPQQCLFEIQRALNQKICSFLTEKFQEEGKKFIYILPFFYKIFSKIILYISSKKLYFEI